MHVPTGVTALTYTRNASPVATRATGTPILTNGLTLPAPSTVRVAARVSVRFNCEGCIFDFEDPDEATFRFDFFASGAAVPFLDGPELLSFTAT